MKKTIMALGLVFTSMAFADPTCDQSACHFNDLRNKDTSVHDYFYCVVKDVNATSPVLMVNHNVLVSGFNNVGTVTFCNSGACNYTLNDLNRYYFDVVNDTYHNQGDDKSVDFNIGKTNIQCNVGQGGRIPLGFGKK